MHDSNERWSLLENASAENRDIAGVIRRLGWVPKGHASLDWTQPGEWEAKVLHDFFHVCDKSQRLAWILSSADFEIGGDEQLLVYLEEHPDRIFKVTANDCYGCVSEFYRSDPELTEKHFIPAANRDPFAYLHRWMILNSITEFQTRFEGFLPPLSARHILYPICVSQPILSKEHANPDPAKIREALKRYGFHRIAQDTYLNFESTILLADAAPRNVWITEDEPVPFDAIASFADHDVVDWAKSRTKSK